MLLRSLLAAAACRYSTSGITQTRRLPENGLSPRSAMTGSTCSTRIRSPSRSTTCRSGCRPRRARSHSAQAPQPPQDVTSATPSSRAKTALARPSGPASRKACESRPSRMPRAKRSLTGCWPGTSSNTAPSAAEAEAGAGHGLERRRLHVRGDQLDGAKAVDEADALGKAPGERGEAGHDLLLQLDAFGLDAVGAAAGARETDDGIDVEHHGEVRQQAAQAGLVDRHDLVDAEPAREALIGERRVEVAVEHEHAARVQLGQQDFVDELGAGGRVQERFGPGRRRHGSVEQELADGLADRRATRLTYDSAGRAGRAHGQAAGGEALAEQRRLGALAAPCLLY